MQQVLKDFPADIIIGDDMLFGVLPMLLGPRAKRPPIALCGTSFLHWRRDDGAPNFAGLPPATTQTERDEYAAVYREHDEHLYRPVADHLNRSCRPWVSGRCRYPCSIPSSSSPMPICS
jgi:hypothetical protein